MGQGKTYAILISNGSYPSWGEEAIKTHDPTIANATASLTEFQRILSDTHYFGSDESKIEIYPLADKESSEVRRTIQKITQTCTSEDSLYLYYVGHGLKKTDGSLYLTTLDSEYELVETTSVSSIEIRNLLARCRAGRKIIILDCCFAGYFLEGSQDAAWDSVHISEMQKLTGTFYMFSSPSNNRSKFNREDKALPTYFTLALVEAIRQGTTEDDEYLTGLQVLDLVEGKIKELQNKDAEIPLPDKEVKNNADKFIFCKNGKHVAKLSKEDLDLNAAKANPTKVSVRNWMRDFPGSLRQKEALNLLRQIEMTDVEIKETSKIEDTGKRRLVLLDLADKYGWWSDVYIRVMDLYDKTDLEEKSPAVSSGLSKVEGKVEEKDAQARETPSLLRGEDNRNAGSDKNLLNSPELLSSGRTNENLSAARPK